MCGIPVVGSDLPGGRVPILDTGFGILTKPKDVSAIATALSDLESFPKEKRSFFSNKALKLYSAQSCIQKYMALFDDVGKNIIMR